MEFIETPIFTKLICELLPDDDYRMIQKALVLRPEAGKIIQNSGGLRKIRCSFQGRGKRGGLRLIYYLDNPNETIYMLLIYKKSKQTNLSPDQIKILKDLIKELLQ
ncbi:Toxin higB-2 [Desulfamplus magnetovallimortis]|uniref:Toxin higB-2 n=1 Tax=Desulfamplus magnetovallimortis TaxID=1246637 RepID=A0A1W1HAR2_9BACT|nr:type II toxin-antitoxin system RelE/ParE family toxin [Desulfamplus magnetovallimortis]MBF0235947.1 type II toxin-antitoxin system RelE/ParE family toxin [Desulfamplus sp.]SLM29581.1 Toxin higB-2 [Desulfamplus magnetovallimortis]